MEEQENQNIVNEEQNVQIEPTSLSPPPSHKKLIIGIVVVFIIIVLGFWWQFSSQSTLIVTNFEECISAGNLIMESYPRQCRHDDKTFTENIGNELGKIDLIRITSPRPNERIASPITVTGEARGTWFFEGDFPIILTDWDGKIIAEGFVAAEDEWMTEDFVQFSGTLEFEKPEFGERGILIFQKDNPSDLPENDDALEVPVFFKENDNVVGILPFESGVMGVVLLGPICSVMRDPPDINCADKAYQTIIQVIAISSSKSSPFTTVETDKEGQYKVMLPPGEYALQAMGGAPFPRCNTKNITVESDKIININLSCDTGIR